MIYMYFFPWQTYQSKLVEFNQRVSKDEGTKLPEHYVDLSVEDYSSEAPSDPTFDGGEYHNGIPVVAGKHITIFIFSDKSLQIVVNLRVSIAYVSIVDQFYLWHR